MTVRSKLAGRRIALGERPCLYDLHVIGRHIRTLLCIAAVLYVGTFGIGQAHAAPPDHKVTLSWNAPAACPDVSAIFAEVHRLLGSSAASSQEEDRAVSATATVTHTRQAWKVDLQAVGEDQDQAPVRRTFHTDSCADLANATALVLAMMVNPSKVAKAAAESAQPKAAESPPPAPPLPDRAAQTQPPLREPTRLVHGTMAVLSVADVGTFSQVGFGAGIAAGAVLGRFRAELTASAEPTHDVQLTGGATPHQGVGGKVRSLRAGGRACGAVIPGEIEASVCLGIEGTYAHMTSYGLTTPYAASTTWREGLIGASLRWAFYPNVGLRAEGLLGFPSPRRQFTIRTLTDDGVTTDVAHTLPPLVAHIHLGADVRF
jgi:hypothetical protein